MVNHDWASLRQGWVQGEKVESTCSDSNERWYKAAVVVIIVVNQEKMKEKNNMEILI